MADRAEERVQTLEDGQDWATRVAAGAAMIGLLAGLCALFVGLAPGV